MALGIQTESNGGDFLPIMKYDARAGRMFRVDRSQGADGAWVKDEVDITSQTTVVMDLAHIEVGYMSFAGSAPDFQMVPLGDPLPDKPTIKHKQGFRMRVFSNNALGGVREWSSAAKATLGEVDRLHDAFEAAPERATGQLPVVKLTGTRPIKTQTPDGMTTNYSPQFEILKWVPRPVEFDAAQEAAAAPEAAPAQTGPQPAQAVQPQASEPNEFSAAPSTGEANTDGAEF